MITTSTITYLSILFLSFNIPNDIVVKSLLSEDETTVYVDLSMPSSADVSFTLVSETGDKMHKWSNQTLTQGRHQIALPLPLIAQCKYQLLINVNNQQYEQLVYKSR